MFLSIKRTLKHSKTLHRILVTIIEFFLIRKNRIKWSFWKKYPFIGRKLGNLFSTRLVPVLYFHWFVSQSEKKCNPKYSQSRWYASIEDFKSQLEYLKQQSYYFLTAEEYYQWYMGKVKIPRKSVLLTFDDGEQSFVDLVLPILEKEKIPALLFVIGKRMLEVHENVPDGGYESQVVFLGNNAFAKLKETSLVTCGSHTYNMHFTVDGVKAIDYLPRDVVDDDFLKMRTLFPFIFFAAPYGKYNQTVYANVRKYYRMGFTVETPGCPYSIRGEDPYMIRRIRVDGLTSLSDFARVLR